MKRYDFRYELKKRREKVLMDIAWWLPRELVMYCYARVLAYATSDKYSDTQVVEITAMEALKRWNEPRV